MRNFLNIVTLVSASLMIVFILIQQRGAGLGEAFGGDNAFYRSRRGVDLVVFQLTVIFAVVFVLAVILRLLAK